MPETMQNLLGQVIDGRFTLRKLLGVSGNSAVFLTSLEPTRHTEPPPDAAIKLIPEDPLTAESQLEHWRSAAKLAHAGLLRIFHFGRCTIDGAPCLYVVVESADEDLGQLLPQRALTADETRGMLGPVLETLDFLHEHGLVHGGLKPANIHAVGDHVKLSPDRIVQAGESAAGWPLAAPFRAPEAVLFPASDIWALGFTVCEALTQSLPQRDGSGRFVLPSLPEPFDEIVRSALIDDATLRIALDPVRSFLDPAFVARQKPVAKIPVNPPPGDSAETPIGSIPAAVATAAPMQASAAIAPVSGRTSRTQTGTSLPQVDPLSVPLSPVEPPGKGNLASQRTAVPVSTLPQVNATIGGPRRGSGPAIPERSNWLFLTAVAAAILLAILLVPRLLLRSSQRSDAVKPAASVSDTAAKPVTAVPAASPQLRPPKEDNSSLATPHAAEEIGKNSRGVNSVNGADDAEAEKRTLKQPAPIARVSETPASSAKSSAGNLSIVRKVLPEVSEKARSTISGTVRINVLVQLNPDGTVSTAELNTPASSKFFADLALQAARQWQLGAGDASELPSSAVIRFDFTQTATSAYLP